MGIESTSEEQSLLRFLTYSVLTDVGKKRSENQDSYGLITVTNYFQIFVVADGMGGVKGGAIASSLAIEKFGEELETSTEINEGKLVHAVQEANSAVFNRGQENDELAGMGTTFVALGFTTDEMFVMHVGDSRAYRLRGERIEQLTHDHTLIQELVDSGALSESQAEDHPVSHMLTRSLGPVDKVKPDCWRMTDGPVNGDQFLLCSDGLYNLVDENEIAQIVFQAESEEAACKQLVDLANERGGTDNITVYLISVAEHYPKTLEDLPESIRVASISEDTLELRRDEMDLSPPARDEDLEDELESDSPEIEGRVTLDQPEHIEDHMDSIHEEVEYVEELPKGPSQKIIPIIIGVCVGVFVVFLYLSSQRNVSVAKKKSQTTQTPVTASVDEPAPESSEQETLIEENRVAQLDKAIVDEVQIIEQQIDEQEAASEIDVDTASFTDEVVTLPETGEQKQRLQENIELFEAHIRALSEPLSGSLVEDLSEADEQVATLEEGLRTTRGAIDISTRKLSVWIGRKRRLETTDPLTLSLEVAAVSEPVQKAKEVFDQITWNYLKKAEVLRYEPDNAEEKRELISLKKQRDAQLATLAEAVSVAVSEQIEMTYKEIGDLTVRRDEQESGLKHAKREQKVISTILKGDPKQKDLLKGELEKDLELLQAELSALEQATTQ